MTPGVALIVLAAAAMHATWNLLVKASSDRLVALWAVFVVGGVVLAPAALVAASPEADWVGAMPFLAVSGFLQVVYLIGLSRAYESDDLSSAYPLARGVAPVATALGGFLVLGESLDGVQWMAIAMIGAGLIGISVSGITPTGVFHTASTGVSIAAYAVSDTVGIRILGEPVAYVAVLFVIAAILQAPLVLRERGRAGTIAVIRTDSWKLLASGLLAVGSYSLILYVVQTSPVGPIMALREVSVVLGAIAGWVFLKEAFTSQRLGGVLVVAVGAAVLILE